MSNNTKYASTLFISEKLLRDYSNISRNTPLDKVFPFVNLAQPFFIENILGDALTTELKTEIATETLTEANKALILKIAPALALWTDFLAARSLAWQVSAKGIVREHSENSESVNEKELGYFIDSIREQAEMATTLLIKFLCRCQDQYPSFRPSSECDCKKYLEENTGDADPKKKYMMYFPNGRRSGCKECDYSDNIHRIH